MLPPAITQLQSLHSVADVKNEKLFKELCAEIDHLIEQDFEKLVYILYRVDVDEARLRYLLKEQEGNNASALIAALLIERQLKKIETKAKFKQQDDIPDDERW